MSDALRSGLLTELERAITDEAYDGGFGVLSEDQLTQLVSTLASTALAVFETPDASAQQRIPIEHEDGNTVTGTPEQVLNHGHLKSGWRYRGPEPQGDPSDARVEAAARRLFGATVDSMTRARELARLALLAKPLIECPHWAPGKITLRNGCTACTSVTEQDEADV